MPRAPGSLPGLVRLVISLVLVWHLAGVILAAWSIPPTSPLILRLAQRPPMQWYLDALYLNHGYQFFAPEPAESAGHVIRYEVFDSGGSVIHQGEFPNTKDQWPRLRYHRYFMLADQAGLPLADEADRTYWERVYLESYARQLLRQYGDGETIRLRRIAHYPLFPGHAFEGRKLDDPETYKPLLEVVQRRSDLGPEDATDQGRGASDDQGRAAYDRWQNVAGRTGWQGGAR
jgi:hypothetical protein